ncbi:hypothetical protein HO133_010999 [Letharia lupina]|uniref:Uncharacterized protein n=1 Tax=Letharia lupina TaxID=560253 RepID=A0A8H6FDF1_9LECA|nr:uncharacterized protein HO133_010999 [Letharia lupina]KAF6224422.1 hypothetical protein HO133_010999 [Letharia lupina]
MDITAVVFYIVLALIGHASASIVSTNVLLPAWLFNPEPTGATFTGQISTSLGTTYYTLDCNYEFTNFVGQGGQCRYNGYTFSATSSTTAYVLSSVSLAKSDGSNSLQAFQQAITIHCGPVGYANIASCTSTYLSNIEDPEDEITADESASNAIYSTVIIVGPESTLYPFFFTSSSNNAASSTATPRGMPTNPMPSPASGPASSATHGTAAKVGTGLGVPLGACVLAGLALLLYRHAKHKERSRLSQMGNMASVGGLAMELEGKRISDTALANKMHGRQPLVYSMELQG